MTDTNTRQLVETIAYELDGWEARPDRYGQTQWAELHGPAGEVIQLRVGPHWIEARSIHDQDLGRTRHWDVAAYRRAEIGFSATKTPARMAAEIRRRLLPIVRENNRLLDAKAALIAEGRAADDALFTAAEKLFPGLLWRDNGNRRRDEAAAWGHGDAIGMEFCLDLWPHDTHCTLSFSSLSRAEVLALIQSAAALPTPHAARSDNGVARTATRTGDAAPAIEQGAADEPNPT
ncbi:hypothetical protein KGQ20_04185 [Catenulispora sp. NF23]|uniref:Uncharacterized protein n=1 Tax=Catenulispora pinistramenti TaxID=2705254 RepID=A0ABS5KKI4_9ACTN|nr:hypothetical protein [Catenulispora pinistramenti]MBS2531963.1 hypothetical protein [Catenulispora pinistramenti]MBS2546231.1 hypothetical protein [Catenulispora pinistramenti]